MFWGLPLEPSKKYTQKVERAFHISHATLDLKASDLEPIQVVLEYEGNSFILAHLSKKTNVIQVPLDLNFDVGEQISFRTIGKGRVFLIGYTILEPEDDDFSKYLQEESDSEVDVETSVEDVQTPGKRKKTLTKSNEKKKKKLDNSNEVEDKDEDDDPDSDSDSDSDESFEEIRDTTAGNTTFFDNDDDDEDSEGMDEESEEDEEDEDEDEDEDDSENESDEEPAPVVTPKSDKNKKKESQSLNASVNGTSSSKKDKKNKSKLDGMSSKKGNETPGKDELSPKKEKQGKTPKQESAQKKTPKSEKTSKQNTTFNLTASPISKRVVEGGLIIEELMEGDGQIAKPGKLVQVHYLGRLKANNKVFDRYNTGQGFTFRLGKGEVIRGWDIGVIGMKAGGRRRLTIPSPLAYGQKGCPPAIPPNSTLVFEVELRAVN